MKSSLNYLALVLLALVAVLPARADDYKGTMTRLGTKMEYSLSGATVTDKDVLTLKEPNDFVIDIKGKVEVGSTISATFKKLIDYSRNPGKVTVIIRTRPTEGKLTLKEQKEGKESATASFKVPDNVKEVEIFMNFQGREGAFNCYATYNVVKKGTLEEKGTPSSKVESFSEQGTAGLMKYSISGGEQHPHLGRIIRPGDKITLSCSVEKSKEKIKTFFILRNNGDVVKKVWGAESASFSYTVPANMEGNIEADIGYTINGMEYGNNIKASCNWQVLINQSGTSSNGASFSRQGTKGLMKYSISGGEKHPILDQIIRPGNTITLSCSLEKSKEKTKAFCILRNNGDVVKKAEGAKSASLSYTIPANMKGIMTADIGYTINDKDDYNNETYCGWNISNKSGATGTKQEEKSTTPKEFNWDDVAVDNNCIHCNREFANYFYEFFYRDNDAVTMCYHDSKETKNPIRLKLPNYLYYRDYIITREKIADDDSEGHVYKGLWEGENVVSDGDFPLLVLTHCNYYNILYFYENTIALLMGRNDDGSDRWKLYKGRVAVMHLKSGNSKQTIEMSQCFVVPTGTTYMLVDDGKTSRVFLLEGSMEVTSKKGSKKQTLTPGQVATVSSDGKIKTQKFDVAAAAKKYNITLSGKNVPKNGGNKNKKEPDNKTPERNRGNDVVKKDDTGGKVKKCKIKGVEFSMIKVEGGTFTMGATKEQGSNHSNQQPTHKVTLSTYYIGETEVTQELWEAVMGTNPSKFKGAKLPVENVSWTECQQFISKINQLTGRKFRLPTEAEWEFAARGGKSSKGYKFAGSNNADAVAWHQGNSGNKTHNVGTKAANELGLYDMCGNVWEWCQDWFGSYSSSAQTNPKGASSGTDHLNRGGGWCHESKFATVFYRGTSGKPDRKVDNLGFRLVLEP